MDVCQNIEISIPQTQDWCNYRLCPLRWKWSGKGLAIVISDLGNILADIFAKSEPERRPLEMSEKEGDQQYLWWGLLRFYRCYSG